jgi:hypothetical protein
MKAQPDDYPQYKPTDDARFVAGGKRCIAWSTTNGRRCIAPCAHGLDVCLSHKRTMQRLIKVDFQTEQANINRVTNLVDPQKEAHVGLSIGETRQKVNRRFNT